MALMAFSDSEVSNDKTCSKNCLQNYEALKKQYDDLLVKLDDTAFKASTYKRGLSILEAQVTDKSKRGFGYTAVPSPHPLILNRPTPLDLSYSGLEEFQQPEVDKDWKENFFHPTNHVRVEEPKKARSNTDAPIIEDWVSDDEEEVESITKVEKKTDVPTATKKESVNTVNPSRRSVRAVLMRTGLKLSKMPKPLVLLRSSYQLSGPVSTVALSMLGLEIYQTLMSNSQLNEKGFVDSRCSRHMSGNIAHLLDFKEFDGGYVTFGGGANGERITAMASPKQTAIGKDSSNPFMAGSLPKTTICVNL
ncbi:hypothetical protein Tco_0974296 [Tanacetum coccineum]|uniref:Uncharacterized protein n=1 Tax=Tanacetum coccineum TaxID=301880 RepID=A0ABQ5EB60_9ASTR